MERYSQYRDRGIVRQHLLIAQRARLLTLLSIRNSTLLPCANCTVGVLSSLSSLPVPLPAAYPAHGYSELFLRPPMAIDRLFGEEGRLMADTWDAWNMVD